MASHEKKWMNKELTSDSMSMAAGERDREVSKEWYVGMKITIYQPDTDTY